VNSSGIRDQDINAPKTSPLPSGSDGKRERQLEIRAYWRIPEYQQ